MCDENWKSKATMSSFMGGVMVGALLLGKLADRIGRRKNMALTTLGTLLFNTGYERLPSEGHCREMGSCDFFLAFETDKVTSNVKEAYNSTISQNPTIFRNLITRVTEK